MNCPECKSPLSRTTLHGESVDQCEACEGLWFDQHELRAVLHSITKIARGHSAAVVANENLTCPRCMLPMDSSEYDYDSEIVINRCTECSGVWLAAGQLEAIAQRRQGSPAIDALADALADASAKEFRNAERHKLLSRAIRSRSASGIVAGCYIVAALVLSGPEDSLLMFAFLLFPLYCIWCCDGIGHLAPMALRMNRSTPGGFVALGGWLVLLSPLVAMVIRLSA